MPKTSQGEEAYEAGAGKSTELLKEIEWKRNAWRTWGFTPFNESNVKEKAKFKGELTRAIQTRTDPAPKPAKKAPPAVGLKRSGGGGGGTGGGTKGKKRNKPAPFLTPKSMLQKSLALVQKTVFPNKYVAGHCCFEAMALSNSATTGAGDKCGAAIIRARFGRAYLNPVVTNMLLSLNSFGNCTTLGPEHRGKLVAEYGEGAVALVGDWESYYYEKRSEMMLQLDCKQTTSNLWHYNNDSDLLAYPLIFYRDLVVIGMNIETATSPESYFFTTYTTQVDPVLLECWGAKQGLNEGIAVEEAYDAELKSCSSFKVSCSSFEGAF